MTITHADVAPASTALSVEPGSAWDIFFFLSEVFAGAHTGHFSADLLGKQAQMSLVLRCCKAILANFRLFAGFRYLHFMVARRDGATVGAAFASTAADASGKSITTLEYVVVASAYRRTGAAEALVRHFSIDANCLQCWCAPESKPMEALLRKLSFKRLRRATFIQRQDVSHYFPAQWQRDEGSCSHMSVRVRQLKSSLSTRRELTKGAQLLPRR